MPVTSQLHAPKEEEALSNQPSHACGLVPVSKAGMAEGLLPENFDEFRSVEYWDAFFRARKSKAFEWYGEWQQLRHLLRPLCSPGSRVLVVGCGNSELSADMCAGLHGRTCQPA